MRRLILMGLLALAMVLLAVSCVRVPDDSNCTWFGVDGAQASCGWGRVRHDSASGLCVAGARAYDCVYNQRSRTVRCAVRYGSAPAESGK